MHSVSDSSNETGLIDLGWNEHFERQRAGLPASMVPARVVGGGGASLRVWSAHGARIATVSGRLVHQGAARVPVVGDWVALRGIDGPIDQCFERQTQIIRREVGRTSTAQTVAANVDTVFVVTSMNSDFNLRRLERYLAMVLEGGAEPVVILSKADLCAQPESFVTRARGLHAGLAVLPVSAHAHHGLDAMRAHLGVGRTGALVGSSGVGKSALVNALLGGDVQREGAIRAADERGKHTTAHRELFVLPDRAGLLVDTPGMRELSPWSSDESTPRGFDDLETLAVRCRFRDCAHAGEPGCAVERAIQSGALDPGRLANYHKLASEQRKLAEKLDPRLAAEGKRRLKSVMRAHRVRGHR